MAKLRVLVVARDRSRAEMAADLLYGKAPGSVRRHRARIETDDVEVDIAIFGEDLKGRRYHRILICQQKVLPEAYSQYLTWRIMPGGIIERVDE